MTDVPNYKRQTGVKHRPTKKSREIVERMLVGGIPRADIAKVLEIDEKTLKKHYQKELDSAASIANSRISQTLFQKALDGDTTAMIWWTKSRMRWREHKEDQQEKIAPNITVVIGKDDADSS